MRWDKALDQGPLAPGPIADWGKFTCYVEVADDGFALRQVYAFESGRLLCYDRTHWADGFGFLGDARLGKRKARKSRWIVVAIDAVEFEEVWKKARASSDWNLQIESSQVKKLGKSPPWLIQTGEQNES